MSFESQFCAFSVAICCQSWEAVISVLALWSQMAPSSVSGSVTGPVSWGRFCSHHEAEMTPPSGAHLEMGGGRAEMAAVFLRVRSTQARSKTKEFHSL